MRIGINLRMLIPGKIGGMEVYVRNLIGHLLSIDNTHEYFLFVTIQNNDSLIYNEPRVHKILISQQAYKSDILNGIFKHNLDLFFCPLLILEPELLHIPTVINIPDMQHKFYPYFFSKEILEWRENKYEVSAKNADAILTLSQYSRDTIIKYLKVNYEKVFPVYLAAEDPYTTFARDEKKLQQVKRRYDLPNKYGFYPANTWSHKNHLTLFKALKIYKGKYGNPPQIILTGSMDEGHSLKNLIKENQLKENIHYLGYVDNQDIPYLYSNASFLIFPSLFEGFGMPILEAMACQCPVLSSNATCLPEIIGDAAILFNPNDADAIAESIYKILHDGELRNTLVQKGIERVKLFSWDKTARETLNIFNKVVESRRICVLTQKPLVTIITSSYNHGEFIEETIKSVLEQDYNNIEYIVIDGGSTDDTITILKKYNNRLKWISEPDNGQSHAINKGLKMAKGEIITWINSDDTYLPNAIKKAVGYLINNPDKVMVYGEGYYIDRSGKVIDRYPTEPFNYERLAGTCFISQPTVFLRREVIDNIGLLDEDLHFAMDYDYWIRVAKSFQGRISYIREFIANTRFYPETKTLSKRKEVYADIMQVVQKHYGNIPESWWNGYISEIVMGNKVGEALKNTQPRKSLITFQILKRFPLFFLHRMLQKIGAMFKKERIKIHGIYYDGWVSKTYETELKCFNGAKKVLIKGRHAWPYKYIPLFITIRLNNKIVKRAWKVRKGDLNIQIDIPDEFKYIRSLRLKINSHFTFIPALTKIRNNDYRKLSFVLEEVKII